MIINFPAYANINNSQNDNNNNKIMGKKHFEHNKYNIDWWEAQRTYWTVAKLHYSYYIGKIKIILKLGIKLKQI